MIGAKTIGNATIVAFDETPVLVADPWLGGDYSAYFGSWAISHAIPALEREEMLRASHVFFSHGHPDHLNPESLPLFKGKKILLPDHVGGRIATYLSEEGFDVTILADRKWFQVSEHVRIYCITDYAQNAALLIDVNGHLLVDMNDVSNKSDFRHIRKITAGFKNSYLLRLCGYGDADMINFHREDGSRVLPGIKKQQVGRQMSSFAEAMGINHAIPFSSFHRYQRTDSDWANEFTTPIEAYGIGFKSDSCRYVDPFVTIDCVSGEITPINPPATAGQLRDPSEFGDDWSDCLDPDDVRRLTSYFTAIEGLHSQFGFLRFKVGGKETTIDLKGPRQRGITFEVPRGSLMKAVNWEIFDDLLIGNFMKTTLHDVPSLYRPNFNYLVTKYADNGLAKSNDQVRQYLAEYRRRAGASWLVEQFSKEATYRMRAAFDKDSFIYQAMRRAYYFAHKRI